MVTIVIPYQDTCPERKRNLNFVVGKISESGIPCIIVEQVGEPKPDSSDSNGIRHLYLHHAGLFQKSKLINFAANHCDSKYIWILDADVCFDFNHIMESIEDQDVIKPFIHVDHFPEEKTNAYMEGSNGDHKNHHASGRSDYFGKYSIILKKEVFDSINGFDERYEGWGWEDIDFIHNRLNKLDLEVHTIESSKGIHFHHPDASRINERRNYYLYRKNFNNSNKTLSFCIHAKNRLDQLKQTLGKNLEDNRDNEEDIEFVLVDMDSDDPMSDWVIANFKDDLASGYLKLYKVFDFPYWHASVAKNTAHYHGEGDVLVNLDCDNFTGKGGGELLMNIFQVPSIVAIHQFCESSWTDGSYGRISIRREQFHELGGYDETFYNMGYQDTDFIKRVRYKYSDNVVVNTESKYNGAIENDKERSIENIPPEIKEKGFFWINDENKKMSKENIANGNIVANKQVYGIREKIRFYESESDSFKHFNA